MIGLAKHYREPMSLRRGAAELLDFAERGAAVKLRLARAEQVEVRSIEDVNGFRHLRGRHRLALAAARAICPPRRVRL
jgi:hypothetical protein